MLSGAQYIETVTTFISKKHANHTDKCFDNINDGYKGKLIKCHKSGKYVLKENDPRSAV
jgi:hypothetical protein